MDPDLRMGPDPRMGSNSRMGQDPWMGPDSKIDIDPRMGPGPRLGSGSRLDPDFRMGRASSNIGADFRGVPDFRGLPQGDGRTAISGTDNYPSSAELLNDQSIQSFRGPGQGDIRGMSNARDGHNSRGTPDTRDSSRKRISDSRDLMNSKGVTESRENTNSRGTVDSGGSTRSSRKSQSSREVSETRKTSDVKRNKESRETSDSRSSRKSHSASEQKKSGTTESGNNQKKNTDPDQRTCIEMRGLPLFVVYSDIREFFRGITVPSDGIKIINNDKGQRTGSAYIRFASEKDKLEGLKRTGNQIDTCTVTLGRVSYKTFDEAVDSFLPPGMETPKPNESKKEKVEETSTCVIMKGLPLMCKEEDITNFFKGITVMNTFIEYDTTDRSRGTGYVEFSNANDLKEAMTRNGKAIGKRYIELTPTSKEKMQSARPQIAPVIETPKATSNVEPVVTNCMAVHGLPFNVVDRQLADFFGEAGYIPHAIHMMLGPNGNPTGDAFIEFNSPKECEAGLKRNGNLFGNKPIQLVPIPYKEMMGILNGTSGTQTDNAPQEVPGLNVVQNMRNDKPAMASPILNTPRGMLDTPQIPMERPPLGPDGFCNPEDSHGTPGNFGNPDGPRGLLDQPRARLDDFGGNPGLRGQPDDFRGNHDGFREHHDGPRGHQDRLRRNPDRSRGPRDGPRGHQDNFRGHPDGPRGHADSPLGHSRGPTGHPENQRGPYSDSLLGLMDSPMGPQGGSRVGLLDNMRGRKRPLLDDSLDLGRPPLLDSHPRMMGMDLRGPVRDGPPGPFEDSDMMDELGSRPRRHFDGKHGGRPLLGLDDSGPFMPDDRMMHDDHPRNRLHDMRGYGDFNPGLLDDHPSHMGPRMPSNMRGNLGRGPGSSMGMRNSGLARDPDNFGLPGCVLGATNIDRRASMEDILVFFDGFGLVQDNIIRRFDHLGRATGDARIAFHTPDDLQRALNQMNGLPIRSRPVSLFVL